MAGEILGRNCVISVGGQVWAAARTKNLTINNTEVDVTADGDSGIQRFLSQPGRKSVEVSLDAKYDEKSESLADKAFSDNLLIDVELDYGGYVISGQFFMPSYSESQEYEDAVDVSVTFLSSGAIIKSAGGS